MNVHARQGIPLRPDPLAVRDDAMSSLVRAALATIHSTRNKSVFATQYAKQAWPEDKNADIILRAPSDAARLGNPVWAGALAQTALAFLAGLVPLSAGADLLQRALQLSFGGAGKVLIPGIFVPMADFVASGAPIPVVQGTSSTQATIEPCKFAVIIALSREQFEGPNCENFVKQALLESAGPSLDRRLFDNVAGVPELRPPGLLNGIVATAASALTDPHAAMIADLSALAAKVAPRAGNSGIVFVMAPKQAIAATLGTPKEFPYPLLTSTALPDGEVICVAANALVALMEPVPRLDASNQSAIHRETNPQPIVAEDGTVAMPVMSSFQTDVVTLRMRWPLSWSLRASDAIAFITGAKWPTG